MSPDVSTVTWRDESVGVLVATMDRRPANALGPELVDELNAALDEAQRRDTRVLVLASAIPGFFVAGADVKHLGVVDAASFTAYGDGLRAVVERFARADLITVVAVEGLALGGGLELAMAATMRVAGADARFELPEVKLGLIPGAAGTQRLPRLVGRGRAVDIMATARQVPADEAHAIGLVDRLVPAGEALGAAVELSGQLRALPRSALAAVVRTVDAAFDLPLADGRRFEVAQIQELFERGEAVEGIAAFVEKRAVRTSVGAAGGEVRLALLVERRDALLGLGRLAEQLQRRVRHLPDAGEVFGVGGCSRAEPAPARPRRPGCAGRVRGDLVAILRHPAGPASGAGAAPPRVRRRDCGPGGSRRAWCGGPTRAR